MRSRRLARDDARRARLVGRRRLEPRSRSSSSRLQSADADAHHGRDEGDRRRVGVGGPEGRDADLPAEGRGQPHDRSGQHDDLTAQLHRAVVGRVRSRDHGRRRERLHGRLRSGRRRRSARAASSPATASLDGRRPTARAPTDGVTVRRRGRRRSFRAAIPTAPVCRPVAPRRPARSTARPTWASARSAARVRPARAATPTRLRGRHAVLRLLEHRLRRQGVPTLLRRRQRLRTTSTTASALPVPSDGGSDGAADSGSDVARRRGDGRVATVDPAAAPSRRAWSRRRACARGPSSAAPSSRSAHTCTFACDPRLIAVKSGSRCPTGLSCLVVLGMDQVDCACPEQTRVGTDGDDCTGSAQCAPGYVCNMMGSTQKCRAVCSCNASGLTCTAPNECANGKACQTLTNDTVFGVCS